MRPFSLSVALITCIIALPALPAQAGWTVGSGTDSATVLDSTHSPDGTNVFSCGVQIGSDGGFLPTFSPLVFASSDGGATFSDISTGLSAAAGLGTVASGVFFINASTGWVSIGDAVYRTTDRGSSWTGATTGFWGRAIHFFDSQKGVVIGDEGNISTTSDGGASWQSSSSPAAGQLHHMYWLNNQEGWAIGHDEEDGLDDFGDPQRIIENAILLHSVDGGGSWTSSNTWATGTGLDSVHFLSDGQTGWVGTHTFDSNDEPQAKLEGTTDGGSNFSTVSIPTEVGTVIRSIFGFDTESPLTTSYIYGISFSDSTHGHLAAATLVGEEQSSNGQGSETKAKVFKIVDYTTVNGSDWVHTDLGTITVDPTSQAGIESDGTFSNAYLPNQSKGWIPSTRGVFRYDAPAGLDLGPNQDIGGGTGSTGGTDSTSTRRGEVVENGCGCNGASQSAILWPLLVPLLGWLRRR